MSEQKDQAAPEPAAGKPVGGLDGSNSRPESMTVDPSVPPVPGEGVTGE